MRSDWKTKPLKYACRINNETIAENTHPDWEMQYLDISAVDSEGNISSLEPHNFADAPSRARRVVKAGDTIISTVRTYLKAIAHFEQPPDNLIASTGFAVLSPTEKLNSRFLWRAVQDHDFISRVVANSEGVGYPAIAPSTLARLPISFPPLNEQLRIASYLDSQTSKIDRLIALRQRQIELLKEQRAAMIQQAVTRGLDPKVPMKDTGIPWLGEVPKHWEVKPFKSAFDLIYRYPTYYNIEYISDGCPEVRGEALSSEGEILTLEDQRFISSATNANFSRTILEVDDIVMSVRGTIGKIGLVDERYAGGNITANLLRLSPAKKVTNGLFLRRFMLSNGFQWAVNKFSSQTTIKTITMPQLAKLNALIPPWHEQEAIVEFIEILLKKSDNAIEDFLRQINLLQEFRSSLIHECVTGQREAPTTFNGAAL